MYVLLAENYVSLRHQGLRSGDNVKYVYDSDTVVIMRYNATVPSPRVVGNGGYSNAHSVECKHITMQSDNIIDCCEPLQTKDKFSIYRSTLCNIVVLGDLIIEGNK